MYAPYKDRPLNGRELERLRLTLSSFRDGSGQVTLKADGSMPGFRDYERALAAVLEGTTPEDKGIFDVLIQAEGKQEQQAILRSQDGDLTGLGVLFELHQQAVFRTAYGIVGNHHMAEEITQQTFVELFTAIKRFDHKRSFMP